MSAKTQALIAQEIPDVVQRYLGGESLAKIAKEKGMPRRRLYRWMLSGLGDEKYADLVTDCLTSRIADADAELDAAKNHHQVAKARETMRFTRMDFERRRPNLYGSKPVNFNVVNVGADAGLIASMEELLGRVAEPKLVESEE